MQSIKILYVQMNAFYYWISIYLITHFKAMTQRHYDYILKCQLTDDEYSHMCVMDSHSTENCKCLNKVFVIFCKL